MRFMTEVTPAVFSRNDSLSSLEYEVEDGRRDEVQLGAGLTNSCQKKYKYKYNYKYFSPGARQSKLSSACVSSPGSFQSHLPRPSAVGRSVANIFFLGGGGGAIRGQWHNQWRIKDIDLAIIPLNSHAFCAFFADYDSWAQNLFIFTTKDFPQSFQLSWQNMQIQINWIGVKTRFWAHTLWVQCSFLDHEVYFAAQAKTQGCIYTKYT